MVKRMKWKDSKWVDFDDGCYFVHFFGYSDIRIKEGGKLYLVDEYGKKGRFFCEYEESDEYTWFVKRVIMEDLYEDGGD
jgi:hypothetical protein